MPRMQIHETPSFFPQKKLSFIRAVSLDSSQKPVELNVPALGVVHEEQVKQSVSSIRQPGEFVLQVVVWLLPQAVLTDEGKLRETL